MIRTSLFTMVLLFTSASSACSQTTTLRMVPSQSGKELVREDSSTAEGIVQITFGQVFKPGSTECAQISLPDLKDAPPLPTGFVSFRDLIYRVSTDAATSAEHAIIFAFPSIKNQAEFERLEILHLEDDELSPLGKSWIPVTVLPDGWNKDTFRFISKATYEKLQPDFSSRRIAAITQDLGVFAIALAPEVQSDQTASFTNMELIASSAPEKVRRRDQVIHTLIIKNNGPVTAEDVNLKEELGPHLEFDSVTATQGNCSKSLRANGRVICHLGSIPASGSVSIKILARVQQEAVLNSSSNEVANVVELVFKKKPTDFIDANNQLFEQFKTVIIKNP